MTINVYMIFTDKGRFNMFSADNADGYCGITTLYADDTYGH